MPHTEQLTIQARWLRNPSKARRDSKAASGGSHSIGPTGAAFKGAAAQIPQAPLPDMMLVQRCLDDLAA
jgi:hypothetical protein